MDLAGKIQENKQKIELEKKKRAEQKLRNAPWSKEVGKKAEREKRRQERARAGRPDGPLQRARAWLRRGS